MFKQKTVIILGAGASAPFGFPLGVTLHSQLIKGISDLRRQLYERDFRGIGSISTDNAAFFEKDRFRALGAYIESPLAQKYLPKSVQPEEMLGKLFDFQRDLQQKTNDTVDEFILQNPSHRFVGKVLLAQEIMLEMYEKKDSDLVLKSFAGRSYNDHRNWYQQLINQICNGTTDSESLMENQLSIVTFNYDHSLEQALQANLGNTEIHQGTDYKDVVDIFHVNGTPSKLPPVVMDVGEFILKCAKTFHLVNEDVDSKVEKDREKAREAILAAERIFVIGFQFDPYNVKAIGLQDVLLKNRVFCLSYSGNLGLSQRIIQLGIPEFAIRAGSRNEPLHISDALGDGFLEQ